MKYNVTLNTLFRDTKSTYANLWTYEGYCLSKVLLLIESKLVKIVAYILG